MSARVKMSARSDRTIKSLLIGLHSPDADGRLIGPIALHYVCSDELVYLRAAHTDCLSSETLVLHLPPVEMAIVTFAFKQAVS